MPLSLAVITYNEEENIVRLLDSLKNTVDEIVIVDSFSTDKTKEICTQKYPQVKFFERKFNGYGEQKNHALDLCSHEWILFLDADEVPDEDLKNSIKKITSSDHPEFSVYKTKFNNHLGIHLIKFGGWGNVYRERLFRKDCARYSNDKVHEYLITNKKSGILGGTLNHYTYKSIQHHITKINKYSDLMAEKMFERGKKIKRFKIIVSPIYEFIKVFIFKLGFMDGFPGYYIAKTMSYYTFLKYIKLYEKIRLREIENTQ
ncbi:Glycosyltransferase involved in cell wall bisynthesis [Chryseobacterium wanjuense]|jgi:glycosyltransferase involved in cell wall biosynthesis|uniref:Glycosyltransferase involved in cell wall bisynthesis n=1 Tax=Chryseobacterium wanjuense TaxID=356305 RepID=A0A1I0S2C5_9FLAO|nr:glycosyltransferase family 2 protein [Chryseobacterium wanjuense]SEW48790.1 Glycosyltransferase involved in cell wall bisynthesis [Chryseobacterium wanjuense]